ncbi:MAG: PAS domain-containing sensor histidine kinase [Thermodesulfobacteriota bacterium]
MSSKKKIKEPRNSNIGSDLGRERDSTEQQVAAARRRLEALIERASLSKDPLLNEALEELSSSLEELGVSEEELRLQNEELMASRLIQEAEQERYQDLFDFTPDGYLVTSPEGIIKEANRAAGLQLGVRQDYLRGKPLRVYIKDRKDFDALLSRFQGKKTKAIEEWDGVLITRGKRAFYARIIIAPIDDHQGRLIGLRWLIRDITERKQAEDALQKSKEQLRHLADQLLTIQENERRKIALEVHDRLGSSLSAIKFKVEDIFQRIDQEPTQKISPHLEPLISLIQDTIEEARKIQLDLRPPLLDDLGITATLSWFSRRFQTIYGNIRVEQEMAIQENEIPVPLKINIFRIAQEALNNIGKHAKASVVNLGLRKVNGAIELTIQDNGEGFDQELLASMESKNQGLGLPSMKERTEISGGSFSVESTIGKGTTIRASWPD